jgi:hypothetical protein
MRFDASYEFIDEWKRVELVTDVVLVNVEIDSFNDYRELWFFTDGAAADLNGGLF